MSVILVVGAGGQGAPCASILARDEQFSEIRLGDVDLDLARRVSEKIGSDKVKPFALDARQKAEIARAADGVDAIINLTLVSFNQNVLEAALGAQTHYVDTACDYGYLVQMASGTKPLQYEQAFRDIGKTALMGCGATPGVTNVLVRFLEWLYTITGQRGPWPVDLETRFAEAGFEVRALTERLPGSEVWIVVAEKGAAW